MRHTKLFSFESNKIQVKSLKELAKEALLDTNKGLLPSIIEQMDDNVFRAFLFYYLVALNNNKLVPELVQPESNLREDERKKKCSNDNSKINLFVLFEEIIQAMCAVSKSYDFSGSFFGIAKGKKDGFIKQPEKRLVQFFSLYFHDFCSQDPKSMYGTMQGFIKGVKQVPPDIGNFKNLYSLFRSRFSGIVLNGPASDYDEQKENIIKSQQILFYLCFWLITSKIMPRGPIEVFFSS